MPAGWIICEPEGARLDTMRGLVPHKTPYYRGSARTNGASPQEPTVRSNGMPIMASAVSYTTREIALPVTGLTAFRKALREEVGPLAAVHALHAAGYASGEDVVRALIRPETPALDEFASESWWDRLSRHFEQRGWGKLEHHELHPGVGQLRSLNWAEAEGGDERQPACAYTTGMISHVLTHSAGGAIAVLETHCRARGDDHCSWVFGSEVTVHELYGSLLEGRALEDALSEL